MDGGIRSGQDILKAVALGAKGTYIGRTYIYGLGAMGEAGVTDSIRGASQRDGYLDGPMRTSHNG
jgi:L-lactate dehydrogenase (cytochrome)